MLEQLDLVVTSHLRSRYVTAEVDQSKVHTMADRMPSLKATPDHLRAAAYMHIYLAELAERYTVMRKAEGASSQ